MGVSIKVKFNYKGKVNKNGRYPVHVYVYIDGPGEQYYQVVLPQKLTTDERSGRDQASRHTGLYFSQWVWP
jgi:hypothetical protein